ETPEPGSVKGTVSLKGLASDPDGDPITKVEVRFDSGIWQPATGTNAWSFSWDTKDMENGAVTVTVRAYDGEDWSEYQTYDYEVANVDDVTDGGIDWTLWVLVAVILVVIVVAVWFLMSRKE
ncbi:MAG: hypothetical protein GWN18_09040, partial [Thermoplasmata archaeon]|nr:hypothetical protein [Thermoplasmata archaeon]NIS12183.1 hypothetical protein [Thermoplasmata archaeon]NIS20100.1 hypothetical protein [Thermoplasmata archaeon]NIT77423.1 hypothetical protein [Thermoplasmata archaeon]NIU49202.1 hypothetical protein [Thermoplasmata archaeon]